ncbi:MULTISPECIES: helix-turn-helix domain-containing protein [unclassified Agrobacterium]|uniref:helix-turn-helix domain-containing protein n=1 Tax=unclassified Agrobacterium TaxID=2632611 RepID=UPI00083D501A|nr:MULTISPECIES: helix-turn-helix transcriptional regulator [unclassified Agrobacterium]AOG12629.1 helix-turn-helix family protein [Agrobacterium sp. RAC06]QGG93478.1 helix-turn-helix domain-containing protein [Agrobacterium sp. MA01]
MRYETEEIADRLREAREAKQLSQRELSRLAGVPQAQISRIETNNVDLRLSSLVAIANALDLEIALVPRKAVPAIKSIMRQTTDRNVIQSTAIDKEMQRLQKAIRTLQIEAPALPELQDLRKALASIQRLQVDTRFLDNLRSLRRTIERANITEQWNGIFDAANGMKALRNQIAHFGPTSEQRNANRPAYSLDEEDDDA